jgi:hypothetical protein
MPKARRPRRGRRLPSRSSRGRRAGPARWVLVPDFDLIRWSNTRADLALCRLRPSASRARRGFALDWRCGLGALLDGDRIHAGLSLLLGVRPPGDCLTAHRSALGPPRRCYTMFLVYEVAESAAERKPYKTSALIVCRGDFERLTAYFRVRRGKAWIFSGCNSRPATWSLQPAAIGAAVEVTKPPKPSMQRVASGDSASRQAVTRVNAEQAPKGLMWEPTRR